MKKKKTKKTTATPRKRRGPPKGQGGRPKKLLSAEQIEKVEEWSSQGITQGKICILLGIPERTFSKRKKDQEELSAAIKKGEARGLDTATSALMKKIKQGDLGSIAFYLKCKHGWREPSRFDTQSVMSPDQYVANVQSAMKEFKSIHKLEGPS